MAGDGDATADDGGRRNDEDAAQDEDTDAEVDPGDGDGDGDVGRDAAAPVPKQDAGVEPVVEATPGKTRAVATAPTYQGTLNSANCDHEYRTTGFEPDDAAKHPLFLHFVGTQVFPADEGSRYDSKASMRVAEAMARRGFVSLSVEYENNLNFDFVNKMKCLFDGVNANNVLATACALPNVDCALGIATWGHSQGALVAHLAANADARVRAVWTTGYGGYDGTILPKNRIRVVNGQKDTANNTNVTTLKKITGFDDSTCPDDGRKECLRADGSGWILVQDADCAVTAADHCWFNKANCAVNQETLEPNWKAPDSTKPFALELNADWVAETVARP